MAKLVPVEEIPRGIFGRMKDSVQEVGDIISPIDLEWDAERDHDDPEALVEYPLLDLGPERDEQ